MPRGRPRKNAFQAKVPDKVKDADDDSTRRTSKVGEYHFNLAEKMSIYALAHRADKEALDPYSSKEDYVFWKKVYHYLYKIAEMDASKERSSIYQSFKKAWKEKELIEKLIK